MCVRMCNLAVGSPEKRTKRVAYQLPDDPVTFIMKIEAKWEEIGKPVGE